MPVCVWMTHKSSLSKSGVVHIIHCVGYVIHKMAEELCMSPHLSRKEHTTFKHQLMSSSAVERPLFTVGARISVNWVGSL